MALRSVELVSGSVTIVFGEMLPGSITGGVTGVVAPVLPLGDGCSEVERLLLALDGMPGDRLASFVVRFGLYSAVPGNIK